MKPELFLPFSRLHQTAQNVEGHGIGLALSKSLIERMGGRIGVLSVPDEGSEFWFELPTIAANKKSKADILGAG